MSHTATLEKQTQIGFAVAIGGMSFIISAALPALAYLLLSGAAISLALYQKQWETITEVAAPIEIDKTTLTLMGFGVLIAGIFFIPLNPINQTVLCSLIGAGIAGYFVNQCVLKSQHLLDKSLQEAARASNVNDVKRLLKLGADPFAYDAKKRSAFYYCIQNHDCAPLILKLLQHKANKNSQDVDSLFSHAKSLFTDQNIREQWSLWGQCLKTCFRENNAQNRVHLSQAFGRIFEAYLPVLKMCLKKLTRYLRENTAYPKNINQADHKGTTVLTRVNAIRLEAGIKQAFQTTLQEMNAKEGMRKIPASKVALTTTQPAKKIINNEASTPTVKQKRKLGRR